LNKALKRGEWEAAIAFSLAWIASGGACSAIADVASTKILGCGLELETVGRFLLQIFDPKLITTAVIGTIIYLGVELPVRQFFNKLFRPSLPDVDDATRMFWRGKISEETFKDILRRRGFDENYVDAYRELAMIIPPISDLIRFAVREAYPVESTEAQWRELEAWASKQGLSKYWVDRYVIAHWQLPGLGELREAFWRGIITEDEYRKFIVKHDFRPDPWPGHKKADEQIIYELSYTLPGAIEQRWMLRWGLIDYDELKSLTAKRGVHPDWIEKVSSAIARQVLEDERSRLLTQLRYLYREQQINKDEFYSRLKSLYYSDAEVNLIIEASELERKRVITEDAYVRYREASRADYAKAYRLDLISEDEFRAALIKLNYPPDATELIIAIEKTLKAVEIEKEKKREVSEIERKTRELSRIDLSSSYRYGLISEDEYKERLKELGYSNSDIQKIIELDKEKIKIASNAIALRKHEESIKELARLTSDEKNSVRNALQSMYIKGILPKETIESRLLGLGYSKEEIELTIEASNYKLQQQLIEKSIEASINEYRYGKISIEQLSSKLSQLGLSSSFVQSIIEYERSRTKIPIASTPEEEVRAMGSSIAIKRFREGITTEVELDQELAMLGYSQAERERIRILAQLERDYNFTMELINSLRIAYRNKRITEAMYRRLAQDFGISSSVAEMYLQLEKIKMGFEIVSA
jgi:predicted DNA-binding transcriptional regulator